MALPRLSMTGWEWSLVDQSPGQSETEWLCVDGAGYKIINVDEPPRSRFPPTAIRSHTPVCMLVTSTANMSTEVKTKHLLTVKAWTPWQNPTALDCLKLLLSPIARQHQPRPGLREFRPGQPCSWKVPAVTTLALPHNAAEA